MSRATQFQVWYDGQMYRVRALQFDPGGKVIGVQLYRDDGTILDGELGRKLGVDALMGNVKLREFTGLLDKNSKEIYEGDIVQTDFGHEDIRSGTIQWHQGGFIVRSLRSQKHAPLSMQFAHWESKSPCLEVIGNIYENPEMLKVKP